MVSVLQTEAGSRPSVLLTGCRQAGKTALLERTFPDHARVSLDVPALAAQADGSGTEFLRTHPPPLLIDEVQYAPHLFRYLKVAIDKSREEPGRFLLTGSQKFSLMQHVSESLAGRVGILELHTLSLEEIEAHRGAAIDIENLLEMLHRGGYPELHSQDIDVARFYASYLATYLERDVRQVLQVRSLRDFDRFLRLCALRSGQLLSMSSFAADVGVSPNTIKSWLTVLEASNVIHLLQPYYRDLGKRLVKTPKLYFLDTGLACALAGLRTPDDLNASGMLGAMFETLVLGQLVRWFANRGQPSSLYFFRDHYGTEVDFVIPVGERLHLLECKWSETPSPRPKGFVELEKALGAESVLTRTVVTPSRVRRYQEDTLIADAVHFDYL